MFIYLKNCIPGSFLSIFQIVFCVFRFMFNFSSAYILTQQKDAVKIRFCAMKFRLYIFFLHFIADYCISAAPSAVSMHGNSKKRCFTLDKLEIFMQKRMKTPRGILPSEKLFIFSLYLPPAKMYLLSHFQAHFLKDPAPRPYPPSCSPAVPRTVPAW